MTEAEILYHIRSCETQRDEYTRKIKKYEEQDDELNSLKSRFASLQNDFVAREQQQLGKLAVAGLRSFTLRSARSYMEGMRSLISGSDFQNANSGLDTAMGTIQQERQRVRDRLSDAEQARKKVIQDLQYWQEQLALLRAEIQEGE